MFRIGIPVPDVQTTPDLPSWPEFAVMGLHLKVLRVILAKAHSIV